VGPNLCPNLPEESDWAVAKAGLDSDTIAPTAEFVRERLMKLLNNIETMNLQKKDAERIRQIARPDSGWDRAKMRGSRLLPRATPPRSSCVASWSILMPLPLSPRAPVGTMPINQFTRHCGARKIYWHHLLGSVES
jgi:hypothetical protein